MSALPQSELSIRRWFGRDRAATHADVLIREAGLEGEFSFSLSSVFIYLSVCSLRGSLEASHEELLSVFYSE